jgi:hypothetical protein
MTAGSLLHHGYLCSSAPTSEEERNREKNPKKRNTEKTKQKQLSYTSNSCAKERGELKNYFSV